jgi:ATP synthase protein I
VLRRAGLAAAAVGVLAIVIGAIVAGWPGALGAIIATVIVLVFFSAGQLALGRVLRSNPQLAMTAALTIYLVKVAILFVFILLFADTTAFDTKVFALTVVAATIAWTVAEVWAFSTAKVLVVDPSGGPG